MHGLIELAIARWRYGPMYDFRIPADAVLNGARQDFILSKYGVRVFAISCEYDPPCDHIVALFRGAKVTHYTFWTKYSQAHHAEYLLSRLGVPLAQKYLNPRNAEICNDVIVGNREGMPPTRSKYLSVRTFSTNALVFIGQMFGLLNRKYDMPILQEKSWKRSEQVPSTNRTRFSLKAWLPW